MYTSVSYPDPDMRSFEEAAGADRLRGRTQEWLADAMTWLAWYSPGVFTAVVDYMEWCDGELSRGPEF